MNKNIALLLAATALLLAGCKNSGDDPSPPNPNPPAVVNQPPTANAGADQLVLTGAAVSLNGSGTDPDGTIATLAWAQTSGTAVTLTGANTGTPTFTAPATSGALGFDLTVTDNLGSARTDSVVVNVNAAPLAEAGPDQTVVVSANVALNGSATDANGTIATYAWTQIAGTAVTLAGGTSAAPTFTAPASVGMLQFRLTVTDNQGATSSDTVNVSVNSLAAPVIVRQPTHVTAYEHGIALIFVVAQGENLNYEWRYASGNLWTSGPEPYMIRGRQGGLQMSSDGECYYVIVSNAAGSATSEEGCLTVHELEGDFEPDDDNPGDNQSAAVSYGNAMFGVLNAAVGPATGGLLTGPFGGNPSMVPSRGDPGNNCSGGGERLGMTLDGAEVTAGANMPLGQHTITMIWDQCDSGDPDEPTLQSGGVMIDYDFPDTFGVGTYTMYFSGHGEHPRYEPWTALNGILHVNLARTVGATGLPQDEIEITLDPHFGAGPLREEPQVADSTIELERRYGNSERVEDAYMDLNVWWNTYDDGGYAGTMTATSGSNNIGLHCNPDDNDDDGSEPCSSDDHVVVSLHGVGNYYLGRIIASPSVRGWRFTNDEPEGPQFPGDDD